MNKIICFIMIIILFNFSFAEEKKCIDKNNLISYYYLNGVWVKRKEIHASIDIIKTSFGFNKNIKISELYNPTENEKKSKYFSWQSYYSLGKDVKEVFEKKEYEFNKLVIDLDSKMKKPNDIALIKKLKGKLSKNNNIIFAHSQGNLVAGEICEEMEKKEKLEIISIATPGLSLPCNTYKTYALYDNDQIISGLRDIKDNYGYIKPNLEHPTFGINHELVVYLADNRVVDLLKTGLEKTKELIYDKNLNFLVVEMKPIASILEKDICNIDTVGDFHKIRAGLTGALSEDEGTKCFNLKFKHIFTEKEIEAIKMTSLGNNFEQVIASLTQIYNNNPELITYLPKMNYKNFIEPVCKNVSEGTFSYISGQEKKKIYVKKDIEGIYNFSIIESSNRKIATLPFSLSCTRLNDLNQDKCSDLINYLSVE